MAAPDRPGLDDNEALTDLIQIWKDGQADIDSRLGVIHRRIRTELGRSDLNNEKLFRLNEQVRRLESLRFVTEQITDDLTQSTRRFINEGRFHDIYAAGAARTSLPFSFTAPHRAAVDVLARDLFDDVLEATSFVDADAKRWVRDMSRTLTGFKLTSGTPVKTQARRFAADLKTEFGRRGIGSVVYKDGSRHGFGAYAEMLLRTKTGQAYNIGTLNQGRLAGIEFYELLDGTPCGLVSHHDPVQANGLIVDWQTAMGVPLSHPACRRSVQPRPDVTAATVGSARSVQSPGSRADQVAFEEALRRQAAGRRSGGRRPRRERRERRPRRERGTAAQRAVTAPPATPLERARQAFAQSPAVDPAARYEAIGRYVRPSQAVTEREALRQAVGREADAVITGRLVERGVTSIPEAERLVTEARAARAAAKLKVDSLPANAAKGTVTRAKNALTRTSNELFEATVNADKVRRDWPKAWRQELDSVLTEVGIPRGGVATRDIIDGSVSSPELRARIQEAVDLYPSRWVARSQGDDRFEVIHTDPRAFMRAKQPPQPAQMNLTPDQAIPTIVHEFGHHMEAVVPEMKLAEWEFYWRRAGNDPVRRLRDVTGKNYEAWETTREDRWANPYMGKPYGAGDTSFYELWTMAAETFLPDRPAWEDWLRDTWLDDDMRSWFLGLLLTL